MTLPEITDRGFSGVEDFWTVRAFLVDLYAASPPGRVWDVRRWDGSYFYAASPGLAEREAARTRIWETEGRIVAALLSEGGPEIHPQIHPDVAFLESAVLAVGEGLLAESGEECAEVLCYSYDAARRRTLAASGYVETDAWAILRRLRFGAGSLPEPKPAPAYTMRPTNDDDADHEGLAELLNAAFGRDFHHAGETRTFQANAPSFRRDLDLVAEAPDGSLAAYAAVCWDGDNRRGIFEPVCTHPEHRQRGLAKALMQEGMRRARDAGAECVDVETGSLDPANALYGSLGFAEEYRGTFWAKTLTTTPGST